MRGPGIRTRRRTASGNAMSTEISPPPPIGPSARRSSHSTGRAPLLHRPDDALILRHLRDAFVDELLRPTTLVRLGREDVALRVGRDAVHAEELPRLPAAVAETRHDLEG